MFRPEEPPLFESSCQLFQSSFELVVSQMTRTLISELLMHATITYQRAGTRAGVGGGRKPSHNDAAVENRTIYC